MGQDKTIQKILIIKPGYSETLDPDSSGFVSLGDILRTTAILHLFPKDSCHVTWLVDERGWPILRGNPLIDRILKINPFTPFHLMQEYFDTVINLEKDPGICAMADSIPAWRRFGFRFDRVEGRVAAYDHSFEALTIAADPKHKKNLGRPWLDVLFEMVGHHYSGEPLVLGHTPTAQPIHDIGFNYRVGKKFPLKAWPDEHWDRLSGLVAGRYSVSWQPAQDNVEEIEKYIDWVASCRLLITNDSLGMHFALALGRPVIALFGPTSADDINSSPHLIKIKSGHSADCNNCSAQTCHKSMPCMEDILPEQVAQAIEQIFTSFYAETPVA